MPPRRMLMLALVTVAAAPMAAAVLRPAAALDLLFVGEAGGLQELWVLREGEAEPERLLAPGIAAFHPAGSARGIVAFMRPAPDGRQAIWLAAHDGSGLRRWSPDGVDDQMPTFSPDGQRVAFARVAPDGSNDLWIGAVERSPHLNLRPRRIVVGGQSPAWSPDGRQIAFASNRDGHYRIWVASADGESLVRVTDSGAGDRDPSWSPDGQQLVLVRQFPDGESDLVIVDLASGAERRIVLHGTESRPAWSPSGSRIALATDLGGRHAIHTISPDGTRLHAVTRGSPRDQAPAWLLRPR